MTVFTVSFSAFAGVEVYEDGFESVKEAVKLAGSSDVKRIADALEKIAAGQGQYTPSNPERSPLTAIPDFITKNGRGIMAALIAASWSSGHLAAYRPSMYAAFGASFLPIDFFWTGGMILAANLAPTAWPIAQQMGDFNKAPGTFLATGIGTGIRFVVSHAWDAVGGNVVNQAVHRQRVSIAQWVTGQQALNAVPLATHSVGSFLAIDDPSRATLVDTPPVSTANLGAAPSAAAAATATPSN